MALSKMAKSTGNREATVNGTIDLECIEGRVNNEVSKKVGKLIEKHPGEAMSVIRDWMSKQS